MGTTLSPLSNTNIRRGGAHKVRFWCVAYPLVVLLNPPIPTDPFGPTGHKSSSLSSSVSSSSSSSPSFPAPPWSPPLSLSELSATSLLLPNLVGSLGCRGRRWTGLGVNGGISALDVDATGLSTDELELPVLRSGIRRGALRVAVGVASGVSAVRGVVLLGMGELTGARSAKVGGVIFPRLKMIQLGWYPAVRIVPSCDAPVVSQHSPLALSVDLPCAPPRPAAGDQLRHGPDHSSAHTWRSAGHAHQQLEGDRPTPTPPQAGSRSSGLIQYAQLAAVLSAAACRRCGRGWTRWQPGSRASDVANEGADPRVHGEVPARPLSACAPPIGRCKLHETRAKSKRHAFTNLV